MTVAELIIILQTYPSDMRVVTEGYEEGYDDILEVKQVKIKPAENPRWYIGAYNDSNDTDAISAIFINGANKGKDID